MLKFKKKIVPPPFFFLTFGAADFFIPIEAEVDSNSILIKGETWS
jgi:hypothetical protein